MKFTDLEVPDFTSPGEDKKSDAIKFVDELMKIAGFFSKKFEVPPVEDPRDQELNEVSLEKVKKSAENLQEACEYFKELVSFLVVTPNASQVIALVIKTYKEEEKASVTFVINDRNSIELTKETLDNILNEVKLTQDNKKHFYGDVYCLKVFFYHLFFVIRFFLYKPF